jgi:hypothetical protein
MLCNNTKEGPSIKNAVHVHTQSATDRVGGTARTADIASQTAYFYDEMNFQPNSMKDTYSQTTNKIQHTFLQNFTDFIAC